MLNSALLGLLWGAVLGGVAPPSFFALFKLKWIVAMTSVLICLLALKFPTFRPLRFFAASIIFLCSLTWTAIHNPPLYNLKPSNGVVVWSNGCGVQSEDLIVEINDTIYAVRGTATEGDRVLVSRSPNGLSTARSRILETNNDLDRLCSLSSTVKEWIFQKLRRFPIDINCWIKAFVFGDQNEINKDTIEAFKNLGLLHILVLSGGHLVTISIVFQIFLRFSLQTSFFTRLISMRQWVPSWITIQILAVIPIFLFCLIVGFSQSIQRAFISSLVMNIAPLVGLINSMRSKIKLTFLLQAIFFPVNLLSTTMILSWTSSLLLIAFLESQYLMNLAQITWLNLKIQLLFFGMSLFYFGRIGILSPVANILGQIVFSPLMILDLLFSGISIPCVDHIVIKINRAALDFAEFLNHIQNQLPMPIVGIPDEYTLKAPVGRCIVCGAILLYAAIIERKNHHEIVR